MSIRKAELYKCKVPWKSLLNKNDFVDTNDYVIRGCNVQKNISVCFAGIPQLLFFFFYLFDITIRRDYIETILIREIIGHGIYSSSFSLLLQSANNNYFIRIVT